MLTEGIHSSADTLNQVLLLIGTRRSHARPDGLSASHRVSQYPPWAVRWMNSASGSRRWTGEFRMCCSVSPDGNRSGWQQRLAAAAGSGWQQRASAGS
jgi:hypothetical protein